MGVNLENENGLENIQNVKQNLLTFFHQRKASSNSNLNINHKHSIKKNVYYSSLMSFMCKY